MSPPSDVSMWGKWTLIITWYVRDGGGGLGVQTTGIVTAGTGINHFLCHGRSRCFADCLRLRCCVLREGAEFRGGGEVIVGPVLPELSGLLGLEPVAGVVVD